MAELYVATPCYGSKLTTAYAVSLLRLQTECAARGVTMACQLYGNESLIQRARNLLVEQFVQSGAQNLLFVDADLAFSASAVLDRLLPFARTHRRAMVGGVYPKKAYDWSRLAERQDGARSAEPTQMRVLDYNLNIHPGQPAAVVDGFARVLDIATGMLLLPRELVLELREAYATELTCENDINPGRHPVKEYVAVVDCMIERSPGSNRGRYLSEDYALSRRVQAIGGEVYADVASGLCHVGMHIFEGDVASTADARPADVRSHTPPTKTVHHDPNVVDLVVVVASESNELGLGCLTSVLRARQAAFAARRRVDIHVVDSLDDALNVGGVGAVMAIVHGMLSFPSDFVFGETPPGTVVLGVHPLPKVHWEDIVVGRENPKLAGLRYNVRIFDAGDDDPLRGVSEVADRQDIKALRVRRDCVRAAASRRPDLSIPATGRTLFVASEVTPDGELLGPVDRLVRIFGGLENFRADVRNQCSLMAPAEFSGCVGMRHLVR